MKNAEMYFVSACFGSGANLYEYLIPAGDSPKVGDMIVTSVAWGQEDDEVPLSAMSAKSWAKAYADGCRVAVIKAIKPLEQASKATKFYLQLIPLINLQNVHTANQELRRKTAAKTEARAQLDKMLREQSVIELYKKLAEVNPEAAALLEIINS